VTTLVLNNRLHVLGRKEELVDNRLSGKVAVVIDVLFATSTIAAALAHGAGAVVPTLDEADARKAAQALHDSTGEPPVLAGELNSVKLPGFAPPTPLALLEHGVAGRTVVYSTTNGTVTLAAARPAAQVYAAALVNGRSTVQHILRAHPDQTVVLICSGSMGNFNIEDYYGAGYLVDLFAEALGEGIDLSDAARTARIVYRSGKPLEVLEQGRVGRLYSTRGFSREIHYAAQLSTLNVVAKLDGQRVVAVAAA
jgi:2-phosphosulfolactate phosphatase